MKHFFPAVSVSMALSTLVLGLACGPAGINTVDSGMDVFDDGQCEASRTTSVPEAGTLRFTWTTDAQISDEQSALGQALGLTFLATELANQSPSVEAMIDVAADGSLPDFGGRFSIVEGCLAMISDEAGGSTGLFNLPTAEELSEEFFATPPELVGSCAAGQVAIGPGGVGDASGTQVCVVREFDSCVSCAQTPTTWTQNTRISLTFRAIGSLEGVATFDPNGGVSRVDILDNDRVTFELGVLVVYEAEP